MTHQTETTDQTDTEATAQTTPPETTSDAPESANEAPKVPTDDATGAPTDTPDEAGGKVADLRNEAKTYRLRLRDTEAELEQTKAEVDKLRAELTTAHEADAARELAAQREEIASRFVGVSADALRGDTPEELEAHAKIIAKAIADSYPTGLAKTLGNHPDKPMNTNDWAGAFRPPTN